MQNTSPHIRAPVKTFLEKFVMPVCAGPITWVVTEKLQLGLGYQLAVIASGVVAAFSASIAVNDEKILDSSSASPRRRIAFRASVLGTFVCIALAVLFGYLGTRARPPAPGAASSPAVKPQLPGDSSSSPTTPDSDRKVTPTCEPSSRTPVPPATATLATDDFLQRYVDTGLAHRTDKPQWAFVISDRNRSDFPELGAAMAEAITDAGHRNVALFRPALVRDGKLEELYSADPVFMRRLAPFCDGVIVGVVEQNPVPDTGVQGVLTVEIAVRVRVIATPSATIKSEFSALQRGAGFTSHEAERNAQERAAQDLRHQLRATIF